MTKTLHAAAIGSVLLLSACGGGGGGGGGTSTPTAQATALATPIQTFPLRNVWVNDFNDTTSRQFTISGTINNVSVAGSGTLSRGPVSSATFEGTGALSKTTTITGSVTADGQKALIASIGTMFVDSNYNPLGGSNATEYGVITGSANIPQTAKVGDAAVLFTMNLYTNSTKTTATGTRTYSYSLEPDTDSTALFKYVTVEKNASKVVTFSDTITMRVTPTGDRTYVSETSVAPGQNLVSTYY